MFVKELALYVDYLREESRKATHSPSARGQEYLTDFKKNLLAGVAHYQQMADHVVEQRTQFIDDLQRLRREIEEIQMPVFATPVPNLLPSHS